MKIIENNIILFATFFTRGVYSDVIDQSTKTPRRHYTYEQRVTAVEAVQNESTVVEVVNVMGMSMHTVFR